ncbi:uncharacterized protein LOC112588026 [Harpegnathos saltator]|uniref:C2H2-type domain-containing protein n=1 Tax=Harpegnathos saltator TaxID=610380 RepID=E2B2M8_HARSA|nr:uncharacterized protein LOC112588026 [Harpegnathos saltator]EFN90050.1 hypothetical protein EAI_00757 [Harpegnathos saltator]
MSRISGERTGDKRPYVDRQDVRSVPEMLVSTDEQTNGKPDFIFPADINLRECSVVIIGSTCQICGRDFKCITDVALHAQWRHSRIDSVLNGDLNLDHDDHHHENCYHEQQHDSRDDPTNQKCDVCDEQLDTTDLKSYEGQMNKKQIQEEEETDRKFRLIIKIAGVTMTEILLSRKYLKADSGEYFSDADTQSESHENEKRQDDYGMNIDLSLATGRVVGNSGIQCARPHKTTDRYNESKLAAIQGNAIARPTGVSENSPIDISNTPDRNATFGMHDGLCASHRYHCEIASSQTHPSTEDTFAGNLVDTIDVCDNDESCSPKRNERESGRNTNPAAEVQTSSLERPEHRHLYRQNNSSLYHSRESVICQQNRPTEATVIARLNPSSSDNSPVWSNKITSSRTIDTSTDPSTEPIEIIIDNDSDDNCDEDMTQRPTARSTQVARPRTENENETAVHSKVGPVVDDEVQEVLRITRGKVQDDINHESPNRTEREILVQSALGQMCMASREQPEIIYPDKNDAILVVNNIDSRGCSPCVAIVDDDDDYQFPTNVNKRHITAFMCEAYNKKVICWNRLQHYGMGYYNNLPEINNNG